MKVLLLDDNLASSTRAQQALEIHGNEVQVAAALIAGDSVDMILINLSSRSLRGVELIPQCHELFPDATVNGFCGHLERGVRRAAKAAGINQVLINDRVFSGELTQ